VKLPHLHQKGKAYYYVRGTKPRKWIPLGSDLTVALRRYERMRTTTPAGTIGALVDGWLTNPPGPLSSGTRQVYSAYASHIKRVFGELYPDEITRQDVLLYLDKCPRTTASHEIMLLRQVYERAIRRGEASANPCLGAKAERPVRPRRTRLLTDAELVAIREKASPVLAVAIDLAYTTGLRPGDLCRLRWGDLEEGVRTQKTGVRLRFEMTEDLRTILEAARALQGRVAVLTVLCERGRPIKPARLHKLWVRAVKAADVKDAQFRDLRAASASARPEDAQKRLGHTTPQMTRTYLRGREVTTVEPLKRKGTA
jgi:integrase